MPHPETSNQDEVHSPLTPFPCLTGLRPSPTKGATVTETRTFSTSTLSGLRNAARDARVTPAAVVQAAWGELLASYVGPREEVNFLSILPRACDDGCCLRLKRKAVCRYRRQAQKQIPITASLLRSGYRLEEELNGSRDLEAPRQDGTVLDLKGLYGPIDDKTLAVTNNSTHLRTENTMVTIVVQSGDSNTLSFQIDAPITRLNNGAARLVASQLDHILQDIVSNPSSSVDEIYRRATTPLLSITNRDPESANQLTSLHSRFEHYATTSPNLPALEFWASGSTSSTSLSPSTVLTYSELNKRASALAAHLRSRFSPLANSIIPICMDRSPELYVTILGILKAGAAWCPIDPSFPPRRRHDLITRTDATALVVNMHSPTDGIPEKVSIINIIELEENDTILSPHPPPIAPAVSPSDLAYLIWTSGTTGPPKGVPIHHQAASTSMRALQSLIPPTMRPKPAIPEQHIQIRTLQFSAFSFDVFVQDLFYTWYHGGTLIAAPRSVMLSSFAELATKSNATHAHLTPAFGASVSRDSCPNLQVVTMIGEKLDQRVADAWSGRGRLYNTYGPAEASVVAIVREVRTGEDVQAANVGVPMPDIGAYVMRDGQVVPRGGVGELALSGTQLSKGYWEDESRTAERFVWNERLGARLYMTGDIVRQLHDGSFEFVGRVDDLVKIQGIRVELSEIAFALRGCHEEVRQVEVQFLARPDRPSKVIVAFLVVPRVRISERVEIEDNACVQVARSVLGVATEELPEYMVPKVFLIVDAIPRTASAKIDRAAMTKLYADVDLEAWERRLSLAVHDGGVTDELDSRDFLVLECITELTGSVLTAQSQASALPSIGIDSITATRLAARLLAQGIDIAVVDILQCRTLRDLLQHLRRPRAGSKHDVFDTQEFHQQCIECLDADLAERVELLMPTLPLQESLLSETLQHQNSYWNHNLYKLSSDIDLRQLKRAWSEVSQRTEALRTGFYPVAGLSRRPPIDATFLQLVYKEAEIDWKTVELSRMGLDDNVRAQAHKVAERFQRHRSIEPPWAVTIFTGLSPPTILFSVHHSIRDERSLELMMTDLHHAYTSTDLVQRHQLRDALSILHTDNDQTQQNSTFWTSSLRNFANAEDSKSWPELRLSSQKIIEGTLTHQWTAKQSFKALQARLSEIEGTTLSSLLRVAWGFILLEYLETNKLIFGETRSARDQSSTLADVIGPLVRVIPVPIHVEDHSTTRQLLQFDAEFHKESAAHYGVQPRTIRNILKRREGEALYPAIFNFLPEPEESNVHANESLWQNMDDVVGHSVEHAIALSVYLPGNDSVEFELTVGKQYMDRAHLEILAQQFDSLLDGILDDPDRELLSYSRAMPRDLLSLVPAEDIKQHNPAWTENPTQWVDRNALVHPEWPAAEVVDSLDENEISSRCWTYQQLYQAYRSVAAIIHKVGYTGRMIAVCLHRCLDVYAVVLAIMYTGNTYLPIAEDLPEERKLFLLRDSEAVMCFTTKSLGMKVPQSCQTVLVENVEFIAAPGFEVDYQTEPTAGAYLLYTSGSTGTPKGVIISRGNLNTFIAAISQFIHTHVDMAVLPGKGKWLGMASYAFDVHLLEMFFPWRHSMSTVTAPRTLLLDNLELALQKLRVTHASFVPSLVDNAGIDPANIPDLRYLSVGGEMITQKAIDTWSRSHVLLANAYGPTEMTIGCCFRRVEPDSNVRNVGLPLPYTTAHVLRPGTTEYALRGTVGELCLTGDLVATGYHKRPDAKAFVDDFHGSRMYRTGDRVRMMADASLEFLGRDDDQAKIRGQRIELVEVSDTVRIATEKVLSSENVDVAAMVLQHPSLARPQLVAFIAIRDSSQTKIADQDSKIVGFHRDEAGEAIRLSCAKTLPSFMVPEHFICLTSLPLAPTSSKIDNKRLQALFTEISLTNLASPTKPTSSGVHTMSEIENTVRDVTAEVLSMEKPKLEIDTNLFRLGLDSLNVINLTIKLQKAGLDSTVSNILKAPTIRQMALLPRKTAQDGTRIFQPVDLQRKFKAEVRNGIDLSNVAAVRPCLPLQETLVASSLNYESEVLYVNHIMLQLSPVVDKERLMKAWTVTAADHEILRTCFHELGKHFVQVVLRESPLACERIMVSTSSTCVDYLQRRGPHIGSDLITHMECRPPIRLTYAASNQSGEKGVLMVSIHHALYDGESFAMILDEVYLRYMNMNPPKRAPFTALIDHIKSQNQQNAQRFWETYLKGYKLALFPVPLKASDNKPASLSKELATPLKTIEGLAASLNTTAASAFQALFGIILSELHSTQDIIFGTVLSGRTVPIKNAHTILAPCITTIPQRLIFHPNLSLDETISRAHKNFVDSIEYQQTALRDIHRWVEAEAPLFDTLFTYTLKRSVAPWEKLWHEVRSSMQSEFPLALEIEADQVADRVVARINYTAVFGTESRARSMLGRLEELIEALARGDPAHISAELPSKAAVRSSSKAREHSCGKEELLMREIVAELVEIPLKDVAINTSFFALGLDSIIAIQFAKRLRQHGIQCSSAHVMRYSSISKLARQLAVEKVVDANGHVDEPQEGSSAATTGDVILPHKEKNIHNNGQIEHPSKASAPRHDADSNVVGTYPCTPLQSSMLTQTLGSGGSLYVHHHGARLPMAADKLNIKKAWEDLVSHTEILRTSFHLSEDSKSWIGFVHHQPPIAWHEHDPSSGLEDLMPQIRSRFVFKEASDFAMPPWSVNLVGDILVLSLHHSLYDGESLSLMLQDFSMLCRGTQILARLPFSKAAHAIRERAMEAEEFWVRSLDGFQGTPTRLSSHPFKEVKSTLDLDLTAALQGCKSLGVTLQSIALLAYGKTLASLSERQDVVLGHVVRGRTLAELDADDVVGPLFNTVPLRITPSIMSATNKNAVKAIQGVTGESQAYQHAALSKVQQRWRERNILPDAELIDALFIFQKKAAEDNTEEVLWDPVTVDEDAPSTEYGINFEFQQRESEIGVCMNSTCIDDLDTFLRKFEGILLDILQRPDSTTGVCELQRANGSVPNGIAMHKPYDDLTGTDEILCLSNKGSSNPTEGRLCTLQKVLSHISGVPASNIIDDTSIFSLGLDSISAIQIAATGRKEGLKISVADVLHGRTVRGIEERMSQKETDGLANRHVEPSQSQPVSKSHQTRTASKSKIAALAGLRDEDVEGFLPCGAGQQYHLATWLKSGRTLGEATFAYICEKPLDCEKLFDAWRSLRERNPILRTVFVATSPTEVVQVLLKPAAVRSKFFHWIDLPDCGRGSVPVVLKREACRHFDLWSPPAELLATHTRDGDIMLLRLHHALYDATTISSLLEELSRLYKGRAVTYQPQKTSILPPSPNLEAAQTYWQESLRNCGQTLLQPKVQTANPTTPSFFFIKSYLPNLHNLETQCQEHHTTLPTVLLLAFARTLAHHTSIPNPTFGLYQSARFSLPESSPSTLQPHLNVTPFTIQQTTTRDTRSSISAIQNDIAARIPYEQSFLHQILTDIGYAETPLFNTFINILPSTSTPSQPSPTIFAPWIGEDMQNIPPSSRVPGVTPVDGLDTRMLAEGNLFLDVQRCGDEDRLWFVGRCDRSVLSEGEGEEFVEMVGRVIGRCIEELAGIVEGAGECIGGKFSK